MDKAVHLFHIIHVIPIFLDTFLDGRTLLRFGITCKLAKSKCQEVYDKLLADDYSIIPPLAKNLPSLLNLHKTRIESLRASLRNGKFDVENRGWDPASTDEVELYREISHLCTLGADKYVMALLTDAENFYTSKKQRWNPEICESGWMRNVSCDPLSDALDSGSLALIKVLLDHSCKPKYALTIIATPPPHTMPSDS